MQSTSSRANSIVHAVTSKFNSLAPKRKPSIRDNGGHEWIPLSGIVAEQDGIFTCLSLGTGMKCLPAARLPRSAGTVLHDWHAEIVAIRAFNRLVLDECRRLSQGRDPDTDLLVFASPPLDNDQTPPFRIRPGVRLHMYCSEAPCRGHFSRLGIVRRKPSRADAPPSSSKSCSDKLALKQCTSLLSSLTSLFVHPSDAYIHTLVLPASQYVSGACERAFSSTGRMAPVAVATATVASCCWLDGYGFRPFVIETTAEQFYFSREARKAVSPSIVPCNLAVAWSASSVEESIVNGILHGRKALDPRGASCMSRRQMWEAAVTVADALHGRYGKQTKFHKYLTGPTYRHIKDGSLLAARRAVKAQVRQTALTEWFSDETDSDFGRDVAS
ncbi:hypothetical protein L249_1369 [Ophiocordyceps polyrhachis-furcata BCC 54312]|uniref:A to I editase domain-containing protein n=1 Tax=Ophiocordyceps polyrhachis-furcata BCC 54312 TaxID=1330021 RepID=A0A367KYZ0_9HYPO|nr:hypothetical protein L249_1369 [Ophiocordyceps polyrhachis-furcata BCC 54312]